MHGDSAEPWTNGDDGFPHGKKTNQNEILDQNDAWKKVQQNIPQMVVKDGDLAWKKEKKTP